MTTYSYFLAVFIPKHITPFTLHSAYSCDTILTIIIIIIIIIHLQGTIRDSVRLQLLLVKVHLRVASVLCVVGGSMGE